jgi:hypothetical protein
MGSVAGRLDHDSAEIRRAGKNSCPANGLRRRTDMPRKDREYVHWTFFAGWHGGGAA